MALKEPQERQAFLGLLVSLGLVDRKDGKVRGVWEQEGWRMSWPFCVHFTLFTCPGMNTVL